MVNTLDKFTKKMLSDQKVDIIIWAFTSCHIIQSSMNQAQESVIKWAFAEIVIQNGYGSALACPSLVIHLALYSFTTNCNFHRFLRKNTYFLNSFYQTITFLFPTWYYILVCFFQPGIIYLFAFRWRHEVKSLCISQMFLRSWNPQNLKTIIWRLTK